MAQLPRAESPDVSVVMVTYNARQWTARALGALAQHTTECYETIIVDNASSDGTTSDLAASTGLTVVQNTSNVGFGPACNQGAAVARGRYVVLLNSDTLVRPGWLEPLVEVADADAEVAAVAPKLLHLDGRLQEAGSILWREGRVLNYGDGDDAGRCEYNFRRDVDYASAACILLRRRAFTAVGGFDPVYSPAYLEDVDLCLAMRSRGWRVVYQPRSCATHARWGSGTSAGAARLAARNRPILRSRWHNVLIRRPPESYYRDPVAVIGGRDAMSAERLLLVSSSVPAARGPEDDGRLYRVVGEIAAAWPQFRVTLVARDPGDALAHARALRDGGVEVVWGEPDWAAWLERRRHHYGLVVDLAGATNGDVLEVALRRTQPQARRVTMPDLPPVDAPPAAWRQAMVELSCAAGVPPPSRP